MTVRVEASGDAELTARFGPLALAIAGRPLAIARAAAGEPGYTDGRTIFLRDGADADPHSEIAVQAMLIAGGSLAPRHVAPLVGQSARSRRYLALEVARLSAGAEPLVQLVLGGRLTLPRAITASAAESLAESARRGFDPPDEPRLGRLRPTRLLAQAATLARGAARDEDLRKPARSIEQQRDELGDDEEADDIPAALRRMASPLDLPSILSRLFHQALGTKRTPGHEAPGAEIPTTSVRRGRQPPPHGRRVDYGFADEAADDANIAGGRWLYPEWDALRHAYRPDWCAVHELPHAAISDIAERRAFVPDAWLEAAVRRLTPALRRLGRQIDGDDLDLDAIVDHAVRDHVRTLHGSAQEARPRVYSAPLRIARDLAVTVLIDISGSVAERDRDGTPIIDEQLHAAAALTRAFALAGDRVSAMAFHSRGRDQCRAILLKGFDERLPGTALRRILSLTPSGYTRLGAGIRHAAGRLAAEGGTARRLLILLSDGVPYDLDYSGRYGADDVAATLREAGKAGVPILWLSFGAMAAELRPALEHGPHRLIEAGSYAALQARLPRAILEMVRARPLPASRRAA